jgi:hypothetical protein
MAFFRTFITQLEQISGSATYNDALTMANAEDKNNSSLERDLNFARTQLRLITGETNWFDAPDATIVDMAAQLALVTPGAISGSLSNIFAFTGMANRNDSSPTYIATNRVAQSDDLELAIGKLDSGWALLSGSTGIGFDRTFMGVDQVGRMPVYSSQTTVTDGDDLQAAIGKLDLALSGTISANKVAERVLTTIFSGSSHLLPLSKSYTPSINGKNMDIHIDGVLMHANTGTEERDYKETDSTHIIFTFNVPANCYISYLIRK